VYCVNLILTNSEWIKIRDAAYKQWPKETLSRGEICRRYTWFGMESFKNLSPAVNRDWRISPKCQWKPVTGG
jgi:hypothetical protein